MSEKLKIFAATVEDAALAQINEMNECEAYRDCTVRIMPDCHAGKGCTIGTVIKLEDRVVPNTVGVDIGCGIYVEQIMTKDIDLRELDRVIKMCVPSGFKIHDVPTWTAALYGPYLEEMNCREALDFEITMRSIGTLGGGNHFIEIDRGSDGRLWLVIHSGSRNLGKRVCEYWQHVAEDKCMNNIEQRRQIIEKLKAEGRQSEIQGAIKRLNPNVKNKALAYLTGRDAEDYLDDMVRAEMYAAYNRNAIANIIFSFMRWTRGRKSFHTTHNYIDRATKILRKGAVSAGKGEELIIPMNMRDGSLLCRGLGNPDWLYSAPHGAGRLMSRKQAFDTLKMENFTREMSDVYSTSVCPETIDESPMAYKPMQEIIDQIGDTVEIVDIIKPIYNFKAHEH